MPNVYVLGFFDCCRQDTGFDNRANTDVKLGQSTKLITVYQENNSKSFVDYLMLYKMERGGVLNLASAVKAYDPSCLHIMTGWDELEVVVNINNLQSRVRESKNYDPNWVNVEDNDDLNTSNESFISSSSDDD